MQPLERRRDDGTGKLYVDIAVDADADADALGGVGARTQTRCPESDALWRRQA